jgi:hypothetical protein
MALTDDDKIVIKILRQNKHYGAKKLIKMFPNKQWSLGGVNKLLKKIDESGDVKRRAGSGRPRTARTAEVVSDVEQLALSQEDAPQTHCTQRQIARLTGISQRSVNRIIKTDLRLKCIKKCRAHELTEANKLQRLNRCRQLLRRYPANTVHFVWFTDEKLFSVQRPTNAQNNRLYCPTGLGKKNSAG